MQTFVPYPDYHRSARVLDDKRQPNQRREALQILFTLLLVPKVDGTPRKGWLNHPAVKMWRGHEYELVQYGIAMCQEWRRRGGNDTCLEKFQTFVGGDPDQMVDDETASRIRAWVAEHGTLPRTQKPPWWGDEAVHRSHRSMLIQKMPDHYAPQFQGTPSDLPYIWPA